MLIFCFFGQKSRVNNLATVGSITWPHFLQKFWKNVAKLLTLQFSRVFFFTCFCSKISFSLQKESYFWKNNKRKVAKLLTYGGQVIDPTAYIYMYIFHLPPIRINFWNMHFSVSWAWPNRITVVTLGVIKFPQNAQEKRHKVTARRIDYAIISAPTAKGLSPMLWRLLK